jgi:hypothetical protein
LGTNRVGEPRRELLVMEIGGREKLKVGFLNYTAGISDLNFLYNLEHLLFGQNINYALFNQNERWPKESFRYFAKIFFPSALIPDVEGFLQNIGENVSRARHQGVDYVIVFLHWGGFKAPLPSAEQTRLARRLCLAGADAVIGAGPHVLQPIELIDVSIPGESATPKQQYDKCVVAYSLGNFVGHMSPITRTGMILELKIAKDGSSTYLRSYEPHIIQTELSRGPTGGAGEDGTDELEIRFGSLGTSSLSTPELDGVTAVGAPDRTPRRPTGADASQR